MPPEGDESHPSESQQQEVLIGGDPLLSSHSWPPKKVFGTNPQQPNPAEASPKPPLRNRFILDDWEAPQAPCHTLTEMLQLQHPSKNQSLEEFSAR